MSLGVSRHGLHAAVEKLNNLALDVESDRLIQTHKWKKSLLLSERTLMTTSLLVLVQP
jgi:hypothetical protein